MDYIKQTLKYNGYKGKCSECHQSISGLIHFKYPKTDKVRKQEKVCEVCYQRNRLAGRSKS